MSDTNQRTFQDELRRLDAQLESLNKIVAELARQLQELLPGAITTAAVLWAAIGTDGTRAVVWGLGDTPKAAIADADAHDDDWRSGGWGTCEISPALAADVRAGKIDCDGLGIAVQVRDGQIIGAEVRQP